MLLLRAGLLELLVCFHVIGGAVLFRRLFPRESPWLGFIVPILVVMCAMNFIEHFIALPELGWLLPFTLGGLGWTMARRDTSWDGLKLPSILFVLVFSWALLIKCANPEITNNTEGVADMARVLDFSLGSKLPAIDSWCPPYDHGGYYSFQHYGASILKRLLSLDIGTGYNMGFTLLNTMTMIVGAGAGYVISGRKAWVAIATLLVLLGNFTGASVLLLIWQGPHPFAHLDIYDVFDARLGWDIGDSWNDPHRNNVFGWIWAHRDPPAVLRLFTPGFNTYEPEFHANLGGHFMTIASLLAANELFQRERSNGPWICLLLFPIMTIITSTWFVIIVGVLCGGSLAIGWFCGRRPESLKFAIGGAALGLILLWPSVDTLIAGSYPVGFHWTPKEEYTAPWEFVIQWWPIIVPWLALCFVWDRLSPLARYIHAVVPLLLIFIEVATFADRGLTVEKMWGAVYSIGLVTFLPLLFVQRNGIYRMLSGVFIFISVVFVMTWGYMCLHNVPWADIGFRLKGDTPFQNDPQKRRLLQVLQRLHGATVLNGKSEWSYNQSPSLVGFSENRCYIAWFNQEVQCGHGGEAQFRDQQSNDFFAGKMANPLDFLRSNQIEAVMIFPDDEIPDAILQQFQTQLAPEFYYIDCKGDAPAAKNVGVFLRMPGMTAIAPAK